MITGTGLSTESMRVTTLEAVRRAKQMRTTVILDIDFRPVLWNLTQAGDGETRYKNSPETSVAYHEIIPFCDLIVGTEEEVCIAGGEQQVSDAICVIHKKTTAPIVLKTGAKGCNVYLHNHRSQHGRSLLMY